MILEGKYLTLQIKYNWFSLVSQTTGKNPLLAYHVTQNVSNNPTEHGTLTQLAKNERYQEFKE